MWPLSRKKRPKKTQLWIEKTNVSVAIYHNFGITLKKHIFTLLTLMCLAVVTSPARAQNFSDVEIKAAYIMKLAKFVTWSGQHLNHINFCYIESSSQEEDASVGRSLARLVHAKNAGAEWSVRELRNIDEMRNCNMLFISDTEESSLPNILTKVSDHDILTMSDARRFIYKEGMLGFVLDGDRRVKMEANLKNIRKTNVMVSATVLELMQEVIK